MKLKSAILTVSLIALMLSVSQIATAFTASYASVTDLYVPAKPGLLAIGRTAHGATFVWNAQGARYNPPVRPPGVQLFPQRPSPIPPVRYPIATPSSNKPVVPGFWDPNRKVNPKGPANGDRRYTTKQDFRFSIPRTTRLLDGFGRPLGTIAPGTKVQINKGAEKVMIGPKGKPIVFELVLGAKLKDPSGGSAIVYGTGLVPRSKIPDLSQQQLHLPKAVKVKGPTTPYLITGGNPKDKDLGSFNRQTKEFVPYKFLDRKTGRGYNVAHRESSDYVARPLGKQKAYVNVLSKLPGRGGTATSVYKISKNNPVIFHRLKDVSSKSVKLYEKDGAYTGKKMKFLKGYVVDPKTHQKTVGWVAEKAVTPKPKPKSKKGSKS